MKRPAVFPSSSIVRIPIAPMRCADCGGSGCFIFACDGPRVLPFCAPDCAAAYGIEPWRSADLVTRMAWPEPEPGGIPAIAQEM